MLKSVSNASRINALFDSSVVFAMCAHLHVWVVVSDGYSVVAFIGHVRLLAAPLGPDARPARNVLVPTLQRGVLTGRRKINGFGAKTESDQRGNVCRRERVAGDKGDFCQTVVEIGVEVFYAKLATLAP